LRPTLAVKTTLAVAGRGREVGVEEIDVSAIIIAARENDSDHLLCGLVGADQLILLLHADEVLPGLVVDCSTLSYLLLHVSVEGTGSVVEHLDLDPVLLLLQRHHLVEHLACCFA
jgi:hypothetical protein